MPALEQAQYELKAAKTSILKLEKELQERDMAIHVLSLKNDQLQVRVDRLFRVTQIMQSRSWLEELLSRFTDEEVRSDG